MDCFNVSVRGNLLKPVKESVSRISRGSTKVWDTLTRKSQPEQSPGAEIVTQNSPIQTPVAEIVESNGHLTVLSDSSLASTIDQTHYTCLSPAQIAKITGRTARRNVNKKLFKNFNIHEEACELTYEQFKLGATGRNKGSQISIREIQDNHEQPVNNSGQSNIDIDQLAGNFGKLLDDIVSGETNEVEISLVLNNGAEISQILDNEAEISQELNNEAKVSLVVNNEAEISLVPNNKPEFSPVPTSETPTGSIIDFTIDRASMGSERNLLESILHLLDDGSNVLEESETTRRSICNVSRIGSPTEVPSNIPEVQTCEMQDSSADKVNEMIKCENQGCIMQRIPVQSGRLETYAVRRNIECSKIKAFSELLKRLRSIRDFEKEVYINAEICLLLATERFELYSKILTEENPEPVHSVHSATLNISHISIALNPENEYEDAYFICTVSSADTVLVTRVTQYNKDNLGRIYVNFNDKLIFEKIPHAFKIHINVYFLHSNNKSEKIHLRKILPKKNIGHPVQYYSYENMLTAEDERGYFLLPVFKKCGTFEIDLDNWQDLKHPNQHSQNTYIYDNALIIKTLHLDKLLSVEKNGFLNFGKRCRGEMLVWNVKYVTLMETVLKIFDSPEDDTPFILIDLKNVTNEVITDFCHLKFSFRLDFVNFPNASTAPDSPCFLRSNNRSDFQGWTGVLNEVISRLREWQMLPFFS